MKRLSRLTALLLAIMLTLSMIPAALAEESYDVSTMAEYIEMRDDLIAAMQAPATENGVLTPSELVFLSRSYTNVADFGAPAVGAAPRMRMMALAANPAAADTDSNGVVLSKTVTKNQDETYTLRLEAYATGAKVTQTVTEEIPTDIILVLDQSGSMEYDFTTSTEETFSPYGTRTNQYFWERYENGNLYYPISSDAYVAVTVKRELTGNSYTAISSSTTNTQYYNSYDNSLYVKRGDDYIPVAVRWDWGSYTYSYTYNGGTVQVRSYGRNTVPNDSDLPLPLYTMSGGTYQYTYSYVDEAGGEHIIATSTTGDDGTGPEKMYQRNVTTGTSSRLSALKNAVTIFVDSVAKKAAGADGNLSTTADNINHRIAVVGFASKSGNGNNTEILSIAGSNSGSVGVAYNNLQTSHYQSAFQSMDTSAGQSMVNSAISALASSGATRADLGMHMAQNILAANPVEANTKRNRVVIMFTDGSPTSGNGFEKDVANSAISYANTIRDTYATTVYSVGIFDGADATSAGTEPSGDLSQNSRSLAAASNWFMQKVSNNKGTPQTPSYYLSAADSSKLNTIFQQISDQIESGGASVTLTEEAVIRDIISDSFNLPAGADASSIKVYTADYIRENTFADPVAYTNAIITITGGENDNKDVSVTNFNFSENWVGTETTDNKVTYRGKKLIIEIPIVVRDGFLGGNNVTTNLPASGIYENANAKEALKNFVSPVTDVAIPAVSVTAAEKNVYLLGDLSNAQLLDGAVVKVGDEVLNFSDPENYGLEPWQHAYVTIDDPTSGEEEGAYNDLTEDTTFTVSATVTPTSKGTVQAVSGSSVPAKINVFKPVLKFKDTTVDYMSTVANPGDFDAKNYVVSESSADTTPVLTEYPQWVHNGTLAASAEMIGEEPALKLTYIPDAGINSGVVVSTTDVAVDVTVSIVTGKDESTGVSTYEDVTDHVTFVRAACGHTGCSNSGVSTHPGSAVNVPEFVLHVINVVADLTIVKQRLGEYEYASGDNESAIVTVSGGGKTWTVVLTKGNHYTAVLKGLTVGTEYTVSEQNGWTWRYNRVADILYTLKAPTEENTVTIVNTPSNPYWLGGDNYATNVFGASN